MIGAVDYRKMLHGVAQFSMLSDANLDSVLRRCYVRIVPKGGIWLRAGSSVDELAVVIRGRLVQRISVGSPSQPEYGTGKAVEATAFFLQGVADTDLAALRDTQLLCLGYSDLIAVCMQDSTLIQGILARLADFTLADTAANPPNRIALCPAGIDATLDYKFIDRLSAAFEQFGEVRTLTAQSFGGALPGALTLSSPETGHILQEQDLAFDVALTVADPASMEFARAAIEEADDVVLIAQGKPRDVSELEMHALKTRGAQHCHLICVGNHAMADMSSAQDWEMKRRCRFGGFLSSLDDDAIHRFAAAIMGGPNTA